MTEEKKRIKDKVINILRKNFDGEIKLDLVSLARYAYKLIPINIDETEYIYSYIINSFPIFNYRRQLNCLKNMILERKKYLELSESQKERYNFFKNEGRSFYKSHKLSKKYNYDMEAKLLYKKEKLEKAYDYYLMGLYITQLNIFNYYLGKMCYKNDCIDEALHYFKIYVKNGGEKLSKSLLYLSGIYKMKKVNDKAQLFHERMIEINKFFENNFRFKNCPIMPHSYFEVENEESVKNVCENQIKKIEIKEEVSINLKERLEDIKRLILMHQDKKADKMLSELEQEKNNMNKKEKQILLQFQKNKKLYRSRR